MNFRVLSNPNHVIIPCYCFVASNFSNFSSLQVLPSHASSGIQHLSLPRKGPGGCWAPAQPDLSPPAAADVLGFEPKETLYGFSSFSGRNAKTVKKWEIYNFIQPSKPGGKCCCWIVCKGGKGPNSAIGKNKKGVAPV